MFFYQPDNERKIVTTFGSKPAFPKIKERRQWFKEGKN